MGWWTRAPTVVEAERDGRCGSRERLLPGVEVSPLGSPGKAWNRVHPCHGLGNRLSGRQRGASGSCALVAPTLARS